MARQALWSACLLSWCTSMIFDNCFWAPAACFGGGIGLDAFRHYAGKLRCPQNLKKTPSNSAWTHHQTQLQHLLSLKPFCLPNTGRLSIFWAPKSSESLDLRGAPRSVKGQLYTWGKGPATGFDGVDVITTPRQVGKKSGRLELEKTAMLVTQNWGWKFEFHVKKNMFHNLFLHGLHCDMFLNYDVVLQNNVSSFITCILRFSMAPTCEVKLESRDPVWNPATLEDFWIFQGSDSRLVKYHTAWGWGMEETFLVWKLFMVVGKWPWGFEWAC